MADIDLVFSDTIRDELLDYGTYNGPIFTDDEIDHLLFGPDQMNEDFVTRLAEAAIYRTSGISVELGVQGPASINVVNATDEKLPLQPHNTYRLLEVSAGARRFDPADEDYCMRPKVTPGDSNIAVDSISFTAGRVKGTPLDSIVFSPNANPIEKAMIDQLSVCQALYSMGANVHDLTDHINQSWGITYAHQLVETASIAPVADVQKYLALGGRPSPAIYISPNVTSKYRIISRPTMTAEQLGVENVFWLRSASIGKLIITLVNIFNGPRAITEMVFHTNPAQTSRFMVSTMDGAILATKIRPLPNTLRGSVPGRESYDIFLRSRQATRVAETVTKAKFLTDITEAAPIVNVLSGTFASWTSRDIIDTGSSRPDNISTTREYAVPSRITALLLSHFHGTADPDRMLTLKCLIDGIRSMAPFHGQPDRIAQQYWMLKEYPRARVALEAINQERARTALEEIESIAKGTRLHKHAAAFYLLVRHATLSQVPYNHAHTACIEWASGESEPSVHPRSTRTQPSNGGIAGAPFRYVRAFDSILARVCRIQPFKRDLDYSYTTRAALTSAGIFQLTTVQIARAARSMDSSAVKLTVPGMTEASKSEVVDTIRIRPIIANVRSVWSGYYAARSASLRNSARMMIAAQPDLEVDLTGGVTYEGLTMAQAMYTGLLVEACIMDGFSLAFGFYQVRLLPSGSSEAVSFSGTVAAYKSYLSATPLDVVLSRLTVDDKSGMFRGKSAGNQKLDDYESTETTEFSGCTTADGDVRRWIMAAYEAAHPRVIMAMSERLRSDWYAVSGVVVPEPDTATKNLTVQAQPADITMFFGNATERYVPPHRKKMVDVSHSNFAQYINAITWSIQRSSEYMATLIHDINDIVQVDASVLSGCERQVKSNLTELYQLGLLDPDELIDSISENCKADLAEILMLIGGSAKYEPIMM